MARLDEATWLNIPGDYLLVWFLRERMPHVSVGRLGSFDLMPGTWIYAGSARGPGGLRARLTRHLRPDKPRHWHVDHLTAALPPPHTIAIPEAPGETLRLECAWIGQLLRTRGFSAPIPGFGNGDCQSGCPAHLVFSRRSVPLSELRRLCLSATPPFSPHHASSQ